MTCDDRNNEKEHKQIRANDSSLVPAHELRGYEDEGRKGTGGRLNDINRERSRFIPADNFLKPNDDYGAWMSGGVSPDIHIREKRAARRADYGTC